MRKWEIHKDLKGNKIFNYSLITLCNNNCIFCCFEQPVRRKGPSIEEVRRALSKVGDEYSTVYLTGGEPTLLDGLPLIIKELRSHFKGNIHLLTNGRRFALGNYVEKFNFDLKPFVFGIPFHSADSKTFDSITRVPGSFKQTLQGIKNLSINHSVELRILLQKKTYKKLPEMAKFILRFLPKIDKVLFIAPDIEGNAYKNRNIVVVKLAEVAPYLEKALGLLEGRFKLRVNQFPPCLLSEKHRHFALDPTIEEGEHVLGDNCKECKLYGKCGGVWRSYGSYYGLSELKPIKKN